MCRIWHCSFATRWILTGKVAGKSPMSDWLIRIPGTPPMYSLRAYAWPRISRYMLPGLRVIVSGCARKGGRYLTLSTWFTDAGPWEAGPALRTQSDFLWSPNRQERGATKQDQPNH